MHYSKTYAQLLESLPPELQENAVQYRKLKKIINQIVKELSSLGILKDAKNANTSVSTSQNNCVQESLFLNSGQGFPRIIYEFSEDSSRIEPRLRISRETLEDLGCYLHPAIMDGEISDTEEQSEADTNLGDDELVATYTNGSVKADPLALPGDGLLWTLQKTGSEAGIPVGEDTHADSPEVIIPLVSDSQFFELLYTTLEHMSAHLKAVEADFMETLQGLSRTIGATARPSSSIRSFPGGKFHALSPLKDHAGSVDIHHRSISRSDLYSWREIFQLYMEAAIFVSMCEQDRGERSVEECEQRLQRFTNQAIQRGLIAQGKFKLKQSRHALETFLRLNLFILNIKKFQLANSEAIRKILKKRTKRTTLRLPSSEATSSSMTFTPPQLALIPQVQSFSLPRILAQAIGEILLPIIPHLDDYSCLICTSIAFKPIRLDCGHLFCVRCLVKMQKRGKGNCPMCRSPCVLVANRSNVDWALMNFMQDWFPLEARKKLKANEKEALAEQLTELGVDPNAKCIIM